MGNSLWPRWRFFVRKSGSAAGLKRSLRRQAVTRQKQESTNDAVGWLARPHLFCCRSFSCPIHLGLSSLIFVFCPQTISPRICTDQIPILFFFLLLLFLSRVRELVAGLLCWGRVFAGLPQDRCGASQVLHNSFCASLYVRLCCDCGWGRVQ
jgi:hypothetical protein